VINTESMTPTTQLSIPNAVGINGLPSPQAAAASIQTGNLTISPDGATLYTNAPNGLEAISTQSLMVTNSAPNLSVGAFAVTPDSQYIYASVSTGVDIISAASLTVTGSIPSSIPPGMPIFVDY